MIRVDAFAKLTLSLHVLGARADGYHEIEALTVSISEPHDALALVPADRTSLRVAGPFAAGVPGDASNLAWRAADAIGATLAIELHKGIPPGAGLGGGSADAAAVLLAVGGNADVDALAARLGADVPFCVHGGAAWVRGVGERLEPAALPALAVVVAMPVFACETRRVYRAWDELGGPTGRTVDVDGFPPLRNDLEPAAERVEPRLSSFRSAVEDAAGRPALLAGSGSAYAAVFGYTAEAERARDAIAAAVDGRVVVGHTTDAGVVVEQ